MRMVVNGQKTKGKQKMIREAKIHAGRVVTPIELATALASIPLEKAFSAASSASTDYWTGNWNDTDSISD
jgi:hypothetical protein